jgi:hypothetical protein
VTDKSIFTDAEWHAVTDAPLLVTAAVFYAGEHGPISVIKEASASARSIAKPGEHGVANELIGEIVAEANSKEARTELKEHRGPTPQVAIDNALRELEPAAAALKKLPPEEGREVTTWLLDIAGAVARSAKTVNPDEQATIDQLRALFGVSGS